jgi:hypothetical protein
VNYRARGITADNKPIFAEDYEHITVAHWLTIHGVFFIHVPNEGKRSWVTGKKLKRMGMKAGVVDFLIFDPPPNGLLRLDVLHAIGAVMELKALDGKKPTQKQIDFMSEMESRGYAIGCFFGSDAAIKWLESLGYGA